MIVCTIWVLLLMVRLDGNLFAIFMMLMLFLCFAFDHFVLRQIVYLYFNHRVAPIATPRVRHSDQRTVMGRFIYLYAWSVNRGWQNLFHIVYWHPLCLSFHPLMLFVWYRISKVFLDDTQAAYKPYDTYLARQVLSTQIEELVDTISTTKAASLTDSHRVA